MNYSIITANVRDDNDYLDEWIDYHLKLGFEHIVIYDHLSKIPVQSKWDNVTVYRLDRPSLFEPEFIHNYTLQNHKSFWMAHIDVDEFIVLFENKKINEFMQKYESHGALGLPWSFYGSSGHLTKPEGRVTDNYLWRRPDENMWIKSIINTQYCKVINDPHHGEYSRPAVNELEQNIEGAMANSPRAFAKINHYFTRSLEEYKRKIERGTGNVNTPPRPLQWFYDIQDLSTIYDDCLMEYDKPKIWDNINGWFNFHNFYTNIVGHFNDAVFVEVGCWEGKSTVFMADKIKRSGKNIKFYAVDIWEDYEQDGMKWTANFNQFLSNIKPVQDFINPIKSDSCLAAHKFEDKSIDFVFIDGNHQYEFIKNDIIAWLPKIKEGGILAGHDTQFEGVTRAINELLPGHKIVSNYWIYDKNNILTEYP
jgi:hypothetical protein